METAEDTAPVTESRLIKVIVGDFSENTGQIICDSLSEDPGCLLTFDTEVTLRSDELVELVRTHDYDLAVLVLNNMIYNPYEKQVVGRIESGIRLVSTLKHDYGLPVIALYGSPRDSSLAQRIMENGADFASLIPCPWQDIASAFQRCTSPQ